MKPNRNSTMRSAFVRGGLIWMVACVTLGGFLVWKAAPEGRTPGADERIAASTLVSRRTIKIQDLRVGDTVLTRDEADPNAPLGHREVTALSRNTAFRLQVIRFADGTGKIQEIRTTDKHPFWVMGKGWTDASQLSAGMSLAQPDGSRAELISNTVKEHADGVPVFNLTVADSHTYFVSSANCTGAPVWVHNIDCGKDIAFGFRNYPTPMSLQRFAASRGAFAYNQWWGERITIQNQWFIDKEVSVIREAAANARTIHFNLDGIDDVEQAITNGRIGGYSGGNATNWELNYLVGNHLNKTIFYRNGVPVTLGRP